MIRVFAWLFCSFLSLNVCAADVHQNQCQLHQCLAVVDAGSTGSRLHIYAYDIDTNHYPTHLKEIWSKKIQPGLATIPAKKKAIHQYLNELFSEMPVQDVSVYFYATAGMRLISQEQQSLIFREIEQWFGEHKEWPLMDAKTISGREEGLYGWLAVNYQLGTFISNKPVGFMDMGGASVQVAFPVQTLENINQDDLVEIDINDKHYSLFIHSFLGLGQTEVTKHFLDNNQCFSNGYAMQNGALGQGDALACGAQITQFLNMDGSVDKLVQPILVKNPVAHWYTMGGLNWLVSSQLFSFKEKMNSKEFIEQANQAICQQSWGEVQKVDKNEKNYAYCLISSYYYALLVNGYGLKPMENIHFISEQQNADWSLGVVLTQK